MMSIYRLKIDKQNIVRYVEKIKINSRIRDIILKDDSIYLLSDKLMVAKIL